LSKRTDRPAFLIETGPLALSPGELDGPSLHSIRGARLQGPTDQAFWRFRPGNQGFAASETHASGKVWPKTAISLFGPLVLKTHICPISRGISHLGRYRVTNGTKKPTCCNDLGSSGAGCMHCSDLAAFWAACPPSRSTCLSWLGAAGAWAHDR